MNFFETKLAFVLTPLTFTVSYLLSFDYFLLSDYKFYFSNIVAIVSIALGFLTTIIFQLWSFNNSPLLSVFREYNLIRNLNLYELTSVISSIIMIILSIIVPLYFSSYIYLGGSKVITAIFNSLLVYMIYCFIRLSYLFFIINKYQADTNERKIKHKKLNSSNQK
ncbi:hypothetical protein [Clostridium perfringens]|uniref:Uncharacterized protein n=3 Tax=Clostridium perfringens TaxID=1502 RepID=A0AAE8FQ84_CLOPF|nr:hypothetical protein [Clostridium perfringens]EGS5729568.1 hypothetical protein [Clostridium perfringens]ELC8330374.1 hypothetical protein [Clostridium perfringens]MBI6052768.1 hypothetical protein [Clostridium perfringens]MDB2051296.1 hypothetical protein [Clostridium perfringens]MDK0657941.1 hypothetical protein [Clostridium perfringens]